MKKNVVAIVQARMGSKRLPKKVIAEINDKPLIIFLLERLKKCQEINRIILAIPDTSENDFLEKICRKEHYEIFRGSEKDVLLRYSIASLHISEEVIVRITGDCPLIDPQLLSEGIKLFKEKNYDYLSNCFPPSFPDGLDFEIFRKTILFEANKICKNPEEREHVTPWIRNNKNLKKDVILSKRDYSNYRWTVDESVDLEFIREIIKLLGTKRNNFSWEDVIKLQNKNPHISLINQKIERNQGSNLGEGQKLWKRAKQIIPGGNMLLSKRSEMFLPDKWPSYFMKSKGCYVWTLDGQKLIDMTTMGVGTNILGYANNKVDSKIKEVISNGIMSSLNCPEEVYLAEKLIEMHPWANKVRFARTGGEANSIAVRIARAASGKDNIAICGYHGWHDWYLASNLEDNKSLNGHLLPGLNPVGVPSNLKGTVLPFEYNDFEELKRLIKDNNIGAIKMEVQRTMPPENGFLKKVRDICTEKKIILIFDECTSGFRETFGGLHKKYKINPDIAIFGKALGNGYAITSIIGRDYVMEASQSTFISSTFWTERIGPVAALETLKIMEETKSWEYISELGRYLKSRWNEIAKNKKLDLNFSGIDALPGFSFNSSDNLKYKTLISQEMLKKGYLASNLCYLSTAHNKEIIDNYIYELETVFDLIMQCEEGREISKLLETDVCHSNFKRLN